MQHTDLVKHIIDDKRYYAICRQIVGRRIHLADDLLQDMRLEILNIKDERLVKAHAGGYLEVFIVGLLNNLWGMKGRAKSYGNGSTSNYFDYANTYDINGYIANDDGLVNSDRFEYDKNVRQHISKISHEYNFNVDSAWSAAKNIIRSDCESQDMNTRYRARVFNYSTGNPAELPNVEIYKNAMQFSKKSKIPYSAVFKTYTQYKLLLQERLKKVLHD